MPTDPVWLQRIDARPKLLALLAYLVAVSVAPADRALPLVALAGLLAGPLLAADLPARRLFWQRWLPILGFALGMAALIAFTRDGTPVLELGSPHLALTDVGLRDAVRLLSRTALAGAALVTLSLTTEGPDLIAALAWFRVPALFVAVLGSVGRTLGLVTAEAARMNHAREVRTVRPRFGLTLRAVGGIIGSLLTRSLGRAERVHRAMLARGFDGTVPRRRPPPPVPALHLVGTLVFGGLSLLCSVGPWP